MGAQKVPTMSTQIAMKIFIVDVVCRDDNDRIDCRSNVTNSL
jgi:hypothetical protein